MQNINRRIQSEVCHNTIAELGDEKLLPEYKQCSSVQKEILKLHDVLDRYLDDEEKKQKIIQDYILELIPPGTKGVIRGNKFNNIVKNCILNMNIDKTRFIIRFEEKSEIHETSEIPDWYILDTHTNKIIIGMNQLDLWGGGQQSNRGSKYLENNKHNTQNSKLLCVVCNEIQFKSDRSKAYKLFEIGFKNDTLCYLGNLDNIICSFFSIDKSQANNMKTLNTQNNEHEIFQNKKLKQTKGLKRNTIDKYYTKQNIVDMCIDNIRKYIKIYYDNDLIIEPSAGNGSFIESIKTLSKNTLFYDINPENEEIREQDYIQLEYDSICKRFKKIHIIGNPPFGRQSSMAIKFIKKSCEFCDTISFILPKSFKKESMKKAFDLKFHLVHEIDLPTDSFLVDGKEHNVPCVFQIWERRSFDRKIVEIVEPSGFVFVKKSENPHIWFRRVGVNAGMVGDCGIDEKSVQSHYFIKFENNKSVEENIKLLSDIKYNSDNTVGPKSISKQELIIEFNKVLQN